jgi:hypothetical protein
MKHHLKRFTAPTFVIAALILPIAITEAQYRQRQRRPAPRAQAEGSTQGATAQQGSTQQTQATAQGGRYGRGRMGGTSAPDATITTQQTQGTGGRKRAARQVAQATLSTAVIQGIKKSSVLSRATKISGNTISPSAGYSLWQNAAGGILVVGPTAAPLPSETITKLIPMHAGSVKAYVCSCGSGENDPCMFARDAAGVADVGKCQNATCCKVRCVEIDAEGNGKEVSCN